MRLSIRRLLTLSATAALLFVVLIFSASAYTTYTYPNMPGDISKLTVKIGSTTLPLTEYPDGSIFSGTKSTMTVAEAKQYGISLSSDLNLRGTQCLGFGRYVYAACFYRYTNNASIDTHLGYDSSVTSMFYKNMIKEVLGKNSLAAGYSAATLKTLMTACRPGAIMRINGHTMIVMAIFNDGIVIYDSNWANGAGSFEVDVRSYTWSEFVEKNGYRGIQALHMPAYYPGYSYSTGSSGGTGYTIDTSCAGTYEIYGSATVNIRDAPTTSGTLLMTLPQGTQINVLGSYGGWYTFIYNNKTCWVYGMYARSHIGSFEDVPITAWYAPYVEKALNYGLYDDASYFYPDNETTRALYITVLSKEYTHETGKAITAKSSGIFKDVPAGASYAKAVYWGYDNGIVKGTSANTYSPTMSLSREQLATFMYRYAIFDGKITASQTWGNKMYSFNDASKVSSWAKTAMEWCTSVGLLVGDGTNNLNPQKIASHSEMITIMVRYADYISGK